jgi:small subunit ribosomal protein S6
MYDYETVVIFHPDLGEAGTKEIVQRVRTILESGKATISKVDEWGLRELAYPIKKERRGSYVVYEYSAEPAAVWEAERQLRLNDQVLRFLSVRRIDRPIPPPRRPRPEGAGDAEMPEEMS